ncbi:Fatty acid desaturase [Nakamurella panacisegetis]|uniref:Fatty acid desaturase n=1 Tax=Nakamurella panacisegetis TaxID=1090615 RepID=A0A1H0HMQ4_9ACTN|nr:acyl-CoA desaturase [Nakamurella panacisegetis]SDO20121.1 Fatty acid desaturase [Nakamurella panacisegetis]
MSSTAIRARRAARPPSDYSQVLQSAQSLNLMRRAYSYYAIRFGMLAAALAGVWVAFAFVGNSWSQLAIAATLGLVLTQIIFYSHDAAHRQVFAGQKANEMAALIMGTLIGGVSLAWWHNKHNKHHAAPNQIGKDSDIAASVVHFYPAENPPRNRVLGFLHRRQGWWFFPLLAVEMLNLHVQGVQAVVTRKGLKRRWIEAAMLVVRLGGYPAILFIFLSPGIAGAFLGVQLAVTGMYLGVSFAASHIGMAILPHDSRIDFFRRQVLTSRNIAGGRIASFAMGGLNYQIEHHLFPSMPRPHLHKVRTVVQNYCANSQVEYNEVSILRAWRIVAVYLNKVGLSASRFQCPMVASLR